MAKRRRKKQQYIARYEIAGLLLICASALAFADLGWIGRSLDSLFMFSAGNWHWLLGIYVAYMAVIIMIRRGPVEWTKRQIGILLVFAMLLIWSQLNLFTTVSANQGRVDGQMWSITMQGVSLLRNDTFETSTPPVGSAATSANVQSAGGGAMGYVLFSAFHYLFDTAGTLVVLVVLGLVCIALLTNRSVFTMMAAFRHFAVKELDRLWGMLSDMGTRMKEVREQRRLDRVTNAENSVKPVSVIDDAGVVSSDGNVPAAVNISTERSGLTDPVIEHGQNGQIKIRFFDKGENVQEPPFELIDVHKATPVTVSSDDYQLPSLTMLEAGGASRVMDQREIQANIRTLEKTLDSFGVKATVINASSGPAVTRYEVQPATGVRVRKIVDLQNDLQLALAAGGIRMEAPIPGKSAVGIEVPNKEIAIVSLKDVLSSSEFSQSEAKLTIGLGRDISGNSIIGNLGRMPHLLVAGATGSGKSVCVNGIIASILYKATPDEVKFIMIDPKVVELNVYNGIPHMMAPVVTDPRRAAQALKKVVAEMESRYEAFAQNGVKDLAHYNEVMRQSGEPLLPYIVVIVDELADLMMVASSDVEEAICRIAQKARASGIHLIVATQRPSVDVITGIIKANIPSRIAFAVSSHTDSKTILDTVGAEKLLGRGDMLYLPVGAAKSIRVQGAFISEIEVERLVQFIKGQQTAEYTVDLNAYGDSENEQQQDVDALFNDAVTLVVEAGQASASIIQRRLSVGYNRAANLIEAMEKRGYVGPFQGSRPREVLLSKEAWQTAKHG